MVVISRKRSDVNQILRQFIINKCVQFFLTHPREKLYSVESNPHKLTCRQSSSVAWRQTEVASILGQLVHKGRQHHDSTLVAVCC